MVVVVGVYFAVSNRDIEVSAFIQSAKTWEKDAPNAVRAIFLNAPTGRTYTSGKVAMTVDGKSTPVEIPGHGHLHLVTTPTSAETSSEVSFEFERSADEPFRANATIPLSSDAPARPLFRSRRKEKEKKEKQVVKWDGDLKLVVLPHGAELSRGLSNTVHWITTDANGEPVAAEIIFKKVDGLVSPPLKNLRTNKFGVANLRFVPESTLRLEIELLEVDGTRTGKGTIQIFTVASQFQITAASPIVDDFAEGDVESLHRSGAMFVDLYDGDYWRSADAFGIGKRGTGFRVDVADVKSPVARVQVYSTLFQTGDAWDVAYVAVDSPTRCEETLSRVAAFASKTTNDAASWLKWLSSSILQTSLTERKCRSLLRAVLAAIPKSFSPPVVMVNSQKRDREALDRWREGVQEDLRIATGVALGCGLLFVLLLVMQGVARSREQERLFKEVDAELEDGEMLEISSVERLLDYGRIAIIVAVLGMFAASMMMLLNFM